MSCDGLIPHPRRSLFLLSWGICDTQAGGMSYLYEQKQTGEITFQTQEGQRNSFPV